MDHNFDELLDELVPPVPMLAPPPRKLHDPDAFIIRPQKFSIGSMQGPLFIEGFQAEIDHSVVKLNFGEQVLFFRIPIENTPYDYPILQCLCAIDDLDSVQLVKTSPRVATLTVNLRRPPRLEADFRRTRNPPPGVSIRRATELDWTPLLIKEGNSGPPSSLPQRLREDTPMKFGLWLTYRFEFTYDKPVQLERVKVALSRLRALDRPGTDKVAVETEAVAPTPRIYQLRTDMSLEDTIIPPSQKYPFDARYLLIGLISQGLILINEAPDVMHALWPCSMPVRIAVLRGLYRLDRKAFVGQIGAQIRKLTGTVKPLSRALPLDRVRMKRVVVTPTRVLLFPEVIETSNRVLRQWPAYMGRFLRVTFADEDGPLRVTRRIGEADHMDRDPDGGLLARIRNVLKHGVWVAGRLYVFLAAGESQMKEHSCWMISEHGDDFTANRVRQQMGDFQEEHVVAKYASRMGLCFSATRHVVDLHQEDIEPLPDVQHGQYVYTDGVGNCSQELATMCAKVLGSDQLAPSAVQIRMGGVKGVLSVHPDLQHNQVCIRPSMQKFVSPHRGLGVMKVSRFAPAHLNRQAICIMSAMGMDDRALLSIFKSQIHHAEHLENDFRSLDKSRHPAKHVYKNAFLPIAKMIKCDLGDQVLLQNVIQCIKCQLLRDLKYKARVFVNDGAYLMGIADDFDILEEGEIYCAITPTGSGSRRVITGQCTIFRTPCIHPGDARLVTAVDYPELDFLTNVVVFSTKKANRDLPSMLGGGDLDGDFYTVIYDKKLQITREHEPMDYTPVTPVRKDKVEMDDICDFVVDFIKSDVLGLVASNFQAAADMHGPRHPICLELAQLNSDAVDFAKSGVPVHIRSELWPKWYPDFMGKDEDRSYPSPRVLGMMYRLIEPAPEYRPFEDICIDTRLTSRIVPQVYLKEAGSMKQYYDVQLEGIMRQHCLCEAEIFAGVAIMSDQKRRRAADDAIRGPVREGTEALRGDFRTRARRFVKENPTAGGLETWAIACYQVTHVAYLRTRFVDSLNESRRGSAAVSEDGYDSEDGEYGEVTRRDLISFPWLWAHEIFHSLEDAVIKEEEEEDEDLSYLHNRWENDSD